jgi:hypothetical protein
MAVFLVCAVALSLLLARPRFSQMWALVPVHPRAIAIACSIYVFLTTIGRGPHLHSMRLWIDSLFFLNGTPGSGVHTTAAVTAIAAALAYTRNKKEESEHELEPDSEKIIEGGVVIAQEEAGRKIANPGEETLRWAGLDIPESEATRHFAIIGGPGSGKTLSIQFLMRSVFGAMTRGSDRRALVYDAKQDAQEMLRGMDIPVPVVTLNPFVEGGVGWDIAADVGDHQTAQDTAAILIPRHKGESQPFFSNGARILLEATMCSFLEFAPGRWTLRDVILALRYRHRTMALLSRSTHGAYLLRKFLTGTEVDRNVESTIETTMRPLVAVASAWEKAGETMGLQEFLDREMVLVLGASENAREVLNTINRVLFMCLTRRILNGPETNTKRTWVFIDELRDAGALEGLDRLILKGRSKGAAVVLGIQDLPSLEEVYSPQTARSIIGAPASKVFLANGEGETLKYASAHFKNQKVERTRHSLSEGSGGPADSTDPRGQTTNKGTSVSRETITRPVIDEGRFKELKIPNARDLSYEGFCDTAAVGSGYPYQLRISDAEVRDLIGARVSGGVIPVSREGGSLREWDGSDLRRLGLDRVFHDSPELLAILLETQPPVDPSEVLPPWAQRRQKPPPDGPDDDEPSFLDDIGGDD